MEDKEEQNPVEDESITEDEDHLNNENLQCRFYRKDFPEEGDLVITMVTKIHENGAYVVLLEYEHMEGLILSTEVTKKRVKSVNKFLKIGKQETMMVIRVDRDKRYIDLSKKKVQPEEANTTEKFFKKSKMVHNILKQTAIKLDCKLIDLYEGFGWDLYDKFEHAYDAFRLCMSDPESVFKLINITQKQQKQLLDAISKKLAPQPVKVRADFELTCFTYEGVDALKEALLTAKKAVNEEQFQVAFKMIAPPHYKCETFTLDKQKGFTKLEEALAIVERVIKEKNGVFKLVNKPQIIGAKDDRDIEDIMQKMQDDKDDGSVNDEDNEEGIDIDIEDENEEDEEEKKEEKKEKKSKKKEESDEEDSN